MNRNDEGGMILTDAEVEMMKRAAEAVRNLIDQHPVRSQWASWVPEYLERTADDRYYPNNDRPVAP